MPLGATALTALNLLVLAAALARGTLPQLALAAIICLATTGRLLARSRSRIGTRAASRR